MLNAKKKRKSEAFDNYAKQHKVNEERRMARINEEAISRKLQEEKRVKEFEENRKNQEKLFREQQKSRELQRKGELKKALSEIPLGVKVPVYSFDRWSEAFPSMDEIPSVFKGQYDSINPYSNLVRCWFYRGLSAGWPKDFVVRKGTIFSDAVTAMKYWLSSFEPSHEHKMACAAYLCFQWFEYKGSL